MRLTKRTIARSAVILALAVVALWAVTYPQDGDPKNIKYVLWKHHLNPWMNLRVAAETVIHDRDRDRLIVGSSKEELRKRFGDMTDPSKRSEYFQNCALYTGERADALYLRQTDLIVIFRDNHAIKEFLCKG
jgi:hypothetical protein